MVIESAFPNGDDFVPGQASISATFRPSSFQSVASWGWSPAVAKIPSVSLAPGHAAQFVVDESIARPDRDQLVDSRMKGACESQAVPVFGKAIRGDVAVAIDPHAF